LTQEKVIKGGGGKYSDFFPRLELSIEMPECEGMSKDLIKALKGISTSVRVYQPGEMVIHTAQEVSGIYFLYSGLIKTLLLSEEGTELVVAYVKAPCFFAEALYFGKLLAMMDLVADVKSEVWFIESKTFDDYLVSHFDVVKMLYFSLGRKLAVTMERLYDISFYSPVIKVYRALILLAKEKNTKCSRGLCVKCTQDDLANLTGLHRVTVNRVCSKLKAAGVILEISRSQFILSPDILDNSKNIIM